MTKPNSPFAEEKIVKVIMEQNPWLLDDELSDVLNNERLVENAVAQLKKSDDTNK